MAKIVEEKVETEYSGKIMTRLLAYMKDYVRRVNDAGGVVSIDIQIRYDSTFDPEQMACLKAING